jgi:penicillin-binding protein 1A
MKRRPKRRSWAWRYRRVLFLFALLVFTGLAGVAYLLVNVKLPAEPPLGQTTYIYASDGSRLASLNAGEDRELVKLEDVPEVVQQAVLAAEDKNFFEHSGVDPFGIARATWRDIRSGGNLQGGSTITQQYIKNAFPDVGRERTLWRKLKEGALAVKLERKLSKEEILERYLNAIYFGRGAYGVQAASRAYFKKDINNQADPIDLNEAAYLAGLIRAPELADAVTAPEVAATRRRRVLINMAEAGFVTAAQRRNAEAVPFSEFVYPREQREPTVASVDGNDYFVDYVRRELLRKYGDKAVNGGGYRVKTTLDPEMQKLARRAVYGFLNPPGDPSGALVAVDENGRIVAMVGGEDWKESQVNLAVGKDGGGSGRQAGSTFKPVLLAETVREGYSVESSFPGPPSIVLPKASNGVDWKVANFEEANYGSRVNLIDATRNSVNTVYAQLAVAVGADKMREMADDLGVKTKLPEVNSLVLGTAEVSVLDMAAMFSTFANRGEAVAPRAILKIETANGTVVEDNTRRDARRVLDRDEADVVNYCLRQVVERGSGAAAQLEGESLIGKTGTTQDFGDAWFVGSTRKLTTAVWMGYPEGNSRKMTSVRGKEVSGGTLPATIFKRFMTRAVRIDEFKGADEFPTPESFPGRVLNTRVPYSTVTTGPSSSRITQSSIRSSSSTSPASTAPASTTTAPSTTAPPPTNPQAPTTTRLRPGPATPGGPAP